MNIHIRTRARAHEGPHYVFNERRKSSSRHAGNEQLKNSNEKRPLVCKTGMQG